MNQLEKFKKEDLLSLDDESRKKHIDLAASYLINSGLFDGSFAAAKSRAVVLYAEDRLKHDFKNGWEEQFNQNHGESASDLMIVHLAQAIAKGDKKDLNQIAKYLNDKTLQEEKPHEIFGLLGRAKNSSERNTFIASRSTTSFLLNKVGRVLTIKACMATVALFVAVAAPSVFPGQDVTSLVSLVGSVHLMEQGVKLAELSVELSQHQGLRELEELDGTMLVPLGKKYRGEFTDSQTKMDRRGRDSFEEMKNWIRSLDFNQQKQMMGLSLTHLRTFVDDYDELVKKTPDASPKEIFNKTLGKHAVAFKDELKIGPQMFAQRILTTLMFSNPNPHGHSDSHIQNEIIKKAEEIGNEFMKEIVRDNMIDMGTGEKVSVIGVHIKTELTRLSAPIINKVDERLVSLAENMVVHANLPPDYSRTGQVPDLAFAASRVGKKKPSPSVPVSRFKLT